MQGTHNIIKITHDTIKFIHDIIKSVHNIIEFAHTGTKVVTGRVRALTMVTIDRLFDAKTQSGPTRVTSYFDYGPTTDLL